MYRRVTSTLITRHIKNTSLLTPIHQRRTYSGQSSSSSYNVNPILVSAISGASLFLLSLWLDDQKVKAKEKESNSPTKTYTMQEVAKHNEPNDCWVVVNGRVYDVTPFVEDHPGGKVILEYAGKDASEKFNSIHQPFILHTIAKKLCIGTLASDGKRSAKDMVDVVVLGGGISGMSCAMNLLESNPTLSVTVLEARSRVGGRNFSVVMKPKGESEDNSSRLDLGGMWIGPQQKRMHALAKKLGVPVCQQYHKGKKVLDLDGKVTTYSSDIPQGASWLGLIEMQLLLWRVTRMIKSVSADNPSACKKAQEYDAFTVGAWAHNHIYTWGCRKLFTAAVRAIFGCEPNEISMLHFLSYVRSSQSFEILINIPNGNQESYFHGGAQQMSEKMAGIVTSFPNGKVNLNSPVKSVKQLDDDSLTVECEDGKIIRAKYAVIAMPQRMADKIKYTPPLPQERQHLLSRQCMGAIMKIVVLYKTPFWRTKGYSGEVLGDSVDGPVFNAYDHTVNIDHNDEDNKLPALVCFVNGQPARQWSAAAPEERKAAVVKQLTKWFGPEASDFVGYYEKDWVQDQWSNGGPIGIWPCGALLSAGHALRQPNGRIHWAGTELGREFQGFMEGAVESGQRAAQEVRERLKNE